MKTKDHSSDYMENVVEKKMSWVIKKNILRFDLLKHCLFKNPKNDKVW